MHGDDGLLSSAAGLLGDACGVLLTVQPSVPNIDHNGARCIYP